MANDISIMVVDDEPDFLHGLARLIQGEFEQLQLLTANSGADALSLLGKTTLLRHKEPCIQLTTMLI